MQLRATALLIMVAATTAHAQLPPDACRTPDPVAIVVLSPPSMIAPCAAAPPPVTTSQWYGWQILLADGAMFSVAAASREHGTLYGWLGTGAVVHFAHGNVGRGVGSLVLRVALPVVGIYAGAGSVGNCGGDWCGLGEALVGGALGLMTAEILDVALLGREDVPVPARTALTRSVSPIVRADDSSFRVGLAGRF